MKSSFVNPTVIVLLVILSASILNGCGGVDKGKVVDTVTSLNNAVRELDDQKVEALTTTLRQLDPAQKCSETRETLQIVDKYRANVAQLNLAQKKSDLDGIYLALSNIKVLIGTSERIDQSLNEVGRAIEIRQKIAEYQSAHDHEAVVKYADMLLSLFPHHTSAKQALKESGLIFYYLQDGIQSLASIFTEDEHGELSAIKHANDKGEETIDLSKILFRITKGKESIAEARKLDPQFEPAIELERMLENTGDMIVNVVALDIIVSIAPIVTGYELLFNETYSAMLEFSRDISPSRTWQRTGEPIFTRLNIEFQPIIEQLQTRTRLLSGYESQDTQQLIKYTRDIVVEAIAYIDAVSKPTGNMIDYKQEVTIHGRNVATSMREIINFLPSKEKVKEDIVGLAKVIIGYSILKQKETAPLLEKHRDLIQT